jgi:hypothetical protein
MTAGYVSIVTGFGIVGIVAFALLQWLHVPAGSISDWLIGISMFAWLIAIATLPWNIHFNAREVLAESKISKERGISVDERNLAYVKVLAQRSLWIAISLHLISAGVFYYLAAYGYTSLGYIGAIAALLLSVLRPIVRAYLFWLSRLQSIRQSVFAPREDIVTLRQSVNQLDSKLQQMQGILDLENPTSWAYKQQLQTVDLRSQVNRLSAMLEELRATNNVEHERIIRESKQLVAQLTTDGQSRSHFTR